MRTVTFANGLPTFHRLRDEMDRLFGNPWQDLAAAAAQPTGPALRFQEEAGKLVLEAELPGVKKEDLQIDLNGDELTIRGERKPADRAGAKVLRSERKFGKFERKLKLPAPVDGGKVAADFTNGVLTLTLPKLPEAQPRRIEVKAN